MKNIFAIFIGVTASHVVLLACVAFTGGCKSPEVLRQREYIPASPPVGPVETFEMNEPFETPDFNLDLETESITPTPTDGVVEETAVDELPPLPEIKEEPVSHSVRKGESFWKIAKHYGVGMKELAAYNDKDLNKPLKIGTVLKIPPGGEFSNRTIDKALNKAIDEGKNEGTKPGSGRGPLKMDDKPAPEQSSYQPGPDDGEHVVQPGESLWKIAVMYNLKTKTLAEVNGLQLEMPLKIGRKLIIPGAAAKEGKTMVVVRPNRAAETQPGPVGGTASEKGESGGRSELVELEEELDLDDISTDVINEITSGGDSSSLDAEVNDLLESESVATYVQHEVVPGDTLPNIAKLYDTTVEKIRQANPSLGNGDLKTGMMLKIP